MGWERGIMKKCEETLGSNGYVHYLEYTISSVYTNAIKIILYILNMHSFLSISHASIKLLKIYTLIRKKKEKLLFLSFYMFVRLQVFKDSVFKNAELVVLSLSGISVFKNT